MKKGPKQQKSEKAGKDDFTERTGTMIGEKMQEALNRQLNRELYSGYLYLSMSADFDANGLLGFASWMRAQAQEEVAHAMKLYTYLNAQGARVVLAPIEAPPERWETPLAALEHTLAHEKKVTGLINDLVKLAHVEDEHATGDFLQWFVEEQEEEEASAEKIVNQIKDITGTPGELYKLDRELGQRIFKAPAQSE